MLPSANRGAGMNMGFPDVCNTPVGPATAPLPYPNIAMNAQATPFSATVKSTYVNALNMGSSIPMTSGDEAGAAHPTIKGASRYTMGNPIVKVEFLPGINLTCPTTGNNMNNPVGAVLVPSVTNVFYTDAAEAPRALGAADLAGLAERLQDAPVVGATLGGGRACIQVPAFAHDTPTLFENELRRLPGALRELVIDLRGNPGGRLDAALRLADLFVPAGTPLCELVTPDGDVVLFCARQPVLCDVPLCIVVDGGTGSAAELFAGALQHCGRATVVGERTHGKASVERVVNGPAGAAYATAARWRLADGTELAGRGVRPERALADELTLCG